MTPFSADRTLPLDALRIEVLLAAFDHADRLGRRIALTARALASSHVDPGCCYLLDSRQCGEVTEIVVHPSALVDPARAGR